MGNKKKRFILNKQLLFNKSKQKLTLNALWNSILFKCKNFTLSFFNKTKTVNHNSINSFGYQTIWIQLLDQKGKVLQVSFYYWNVFSLESYEEVNF